MAKEKAAVAAVAAKKSDLILSYQASRRASVPILGIETPDPAATISSIRAVLNGATPTLEWDYALGLRGVNALGEDALAGLVGATLPADPKERARMLKSLFPKSVNPTEMLMALERLPENAVVFLHNFHLQLNDMDAGSRAATTQALWNLRDRLKHGFRQVVLLGPVLKMPAQIARDVIILKDPLPTRVQLGVMLDQMYATAKSADEAFVAAAPDPETRRKALDALVGLAMFSAEQAVSMNMTRAGVNVPALWREKIQIIEKTAGLSVWKPMPGETLTLDDLKGLDAIVGFMKTLITLDLFGPVVLIDEGQRAAAGGLSSWVGDNGVGQDQIKNLLTFIVDHKVIGVLAAGFAGCGKTELAKAVAAACGKPLIMLDLGGMKGSGHGESEMAIRMALNVVEAMSDGKPPLFIMTANKTEMPPEMNRRFPDQFFFENPDAAGRAAIWQVHARINGLSQEQAVVPAGMDDGWTPDEIRRTCVRAAQFKITVAAASKYIVPQSVSAAAELADLRARADGKFLSAAKPGVYRATDHEREPELVSVSGGRRITFEEEES